MSEKMRTFDTGATRSSDENKLDFEGFFHPVVLKCYAEYLHKHRRQADGNMRSSDNWQKGMPQEDYMKSKFRHFMDTWLIHRGCPSGASTIEESLCAELFNTMGLLFEVLKEGDKIA